MKYLLLIYQEEKQWAGMSEAERQQMYAEYGQLRQELTTRGQFVGGSQLHPVATASSVRVRNSKELITDGPFAETHEQLGGYFLIEVKNLDEALGIAARIPSAREGTVEVRPIVERTAEAAA
ncbi:MAG TPA: YciI family protein [Pyrinomonadaceae bacterium]|nr:YciI family protein [Pyrinomonadaceae bacterium]